MSIERRIDCHTSEVKGGRTGAARWMCERRGGQATTETKPSGSCDPSLGWGGGRMCVGCVRFRMRASMRGKQVVRGSGDEVTSWRWRSEEVVDSYQGQGT